MLPCLLQFCSPLDCIKLNLSQPSLLWRSSPSPSFQRYSKSWNVTQSHCISLWPSSCGWLPLSSWLHSTPLSMSSTNASLASCGSFVQHGYLYSLTRIRKGCGARGISPSYLTVMNMMWASLQLMTRAPLSPVSLAHLPPRPHLSCLQGSSSPVRRAINYFDFLYLSRMESTICRPTSTTIDVLLFPSISAVRRWLSSHPSFGE